MTRTADPSGGPPHAARPRWPYLAFFAVAAVFGWQLLFAGRILLPTNPATIAPWFGDASPEATAVPSNGLMMDTLIFTLPARVYNAQMLRAGQIPFWNPHVFNGYPHFALIQNNVLYPLSTIFDLIEPISGMGFSICLHLALAGCLMFAFLRARDLDDGAAFLGAAAFELNGMFLIRVSAPSYVFSGTWLPLMLLGALRVARSGSVRRGWPLLVATTASVLGGHPQITSLCLTLAGVFLLVEAVARAAVGGALAHLVRAVAAFAALVLLGVGVAGYQVVPFLELMANSARGGVALSVYRKASMPFTGLAQALLPDLYGHPLEMDYWLPDRAPLLDGIAARDRVWALNFSGQNLYTGIVPLVLAVVAVLRAPRRRDVLLFAGAALFSLGVLLGPPMIDVAYALIPGFRHSRPDRITFVYMSALSVLTAYGYAAVTRAGGTADGAGTRRTGALTIAVAALVLVLWPIVPRLADAAARADLATWLREARVQWAAHRALLLPEIAATCLLLLAVVCLTMPALARRLPRAATLAAWTLLLLVPSLLFGWRFNPMQYRPVLGATAMEKAVVQAGAGQPVRIARILPGLPQALPANVVQLLGVDDIHGASAAGVRDYVDLIDAAEHGAIAAHKYFRAFRDPAIASGHVLDVLNAGLVLGNVELPAQYERLASEDGLTLWRNPHALPRFFVVEQTEAYGDQDDGRARLLAPGFDPATHVLVRAEDAAAVALPSQTAADASAAAARRAGAQPGVTITSSAPHRITLHVEAPRPGVLVSSEVFYPGWQTRIDGALVPTLLVNTAFRGAPLPAGTHDVELRFVPRSFQLGVGLSVVSLLIVAVMWRPRRGGTTARL